MESLGDRMKQQYENRTQVLLPRRTYTIIRLDGRAFHTFTRKMAKPFDTALMSWMDFAAEEVCRQVDGAQFAYIQSDEISVLATDFAKPETAAWFDGNLQKIVSISASVATAAFNAASDVIQRAYFDSRVFTIPDPVEVENYFIWRQKDWERNSLAMVCGQYYSHKEMFGKQRPEQHEMIHAKGDNWALYPDDQKRGRCFVHEKGERGWTRVVPPIWTADRDHLRSLIPLHWEVKDNQEETEAA